MIIITEAIKDKDGKEIRPAVYQKEVVTTRTERFTEAQIDKQIERINEELAKWTALKAEVQAAKG